MHRRATRAAFASLTALLLAPAMTAGDTPPALPQPVIEQALPEQPQPTGIRITVDEAIARALRSNKRIRVSSFDPGIARANVLAEYGRFDPALTFRRSRAEDEIPVSVNPLVRELTRTDNYSLSFDGFTPWGLTYQIGASARNQRDALNPLSDNYVTFGGVSVTQPLLKGFGFGANLAGLRIAKANRSISDLEHRQTVIDVVTEVLNAYQDLAQASEYLRIAHRSRDLAARTYSDNQKRNKIGYISDADVTQARARLLNREEAILVYERAVRDYDNRLRQLMGEPIVQEGPTLLVEPLPPVPLPVIDGAAELRNALEHRPDYLAAKAVITKFRAARSLARNEALPRVDFVGSYGYNGTDRDFAASRAQVRQQDFRSYSAGVVVSIPLTFAEERGRARAAKLTVEQSEANLERIEQDIAVSVASAIGQLRTTAQRVEVTAGAYDLAVQAFIAEQKRLLAGSSSTFVVLQLQEQLATAENNRVRAIADQHRAIANLQRETGRTLEAHQLVLE